MGNSYLSTYLNDHLAGAEAALTLMSTLEARPLEPAMQRVLVKIHGDIEADREELAALMSRLEIPESRLRKATGWLAERLTQVKLRLDDPADGGLRSFESLEALAIGIEGKRALWMALDSAADRLPELEGPDYERLQARAVDQRCGIESLRLEAARTALASNSSSS